MSLYDFCNVCKLPYESNVSEPRPRDAEGFIDEVTVGEERGVLEARVASLHFPVLLLLIICGEMFDWSWGEWRP